MTLYHSFLQKHRSLSLPVNVWHGKGAALEEKSWHKWIDIYRRRETRPTLKTRWASTGCGMFTKVKRRKSWILPKPTTWDLDSTKTSKSRFHCSPRSFRRQRARSRKMKEMATTAKERMRREKEKEDGSCATGSAPTTSPANRYTWYFGNECIW